MKRITEYENITTVAEGDVLPIVDVSDTSQASTGSTKKGSIEKIADYLKARAETLSNKTIDSSVNVVEVLKKVYPIGCIYISSVSTSPATLFGFGTWSLVGEGKALFGVDSGDSDFDEAEATGGSKTHTLTITEMPEHTHTQSAHTHTQNAHTHTQNPHGHDLVSANTAARNIAGTGGLQGTQATAPTTIESTTATNQNTTATNQNTTATNQNTGGGEAHSILNPYYTAYFYKRTA